MAKKIKPILTIRLLKPVSIPVAFTLTQITSSVAAIKKFFFLASLT